MKMLHFAVALAMALAYAGAPATPAHALETTAGGSMSMQASWSALKALIQNNTTNLTILDADVKQIKLCNTKGMVYAPGDTSDDDGCINTVEPKATTIITCGEGGKVYNGTACVNPKPSCTLHKKASGRSSCPAGTVSIYQSTEHNSDGGTTYKYYDCLWIVCQ